MENQIKPRLLSIPRLINPSSSAVEEDHHSFIHNHTQASMSSSISFISKTPFFKSNFLSPRRGIEMASSSSSMAPLTKNPQSTNTLQLINNNQYKDSLIQGNGFDKSALTQLGSISDLNFINVSIEIEIKEFMERLEKVVEEFRILEMEKLMSRAKSGGEMVFSIEEAEIMSREIVCKFLEKPMKYLSCGNVKLEDKLKDLKILVRLLEESSCLGKQKDVSKKKKSLCLRHSFS